MRAIERSPHDGARSGYTLVEMMVALVAVAILGALAWTFAEVGTSVHERELRRADAERTARNLEASVGRAIEEVTSGGFSAPNLGMIRVGPRVTAAGAAADSLILLRARGPAVQVASRPCRIASAAICVALRGDQSEDVRAGDVLAIGSSRIGYRLLQVSTVDGPYTAPCGADCPAATFCTVSTDARMTVVEVLLGTHRPSGTTAASCAASFFPDGSRCEETRTTRMTPPRPRSVCAVTGSPAVFTDIRGADRTVTLGFPPAREWSGISGGGAPAVAAIPVEPIRLHVAPEGTALAVHMSRGLVVGGAWSDPRRVAGPVAAFRVESQHAGNLAWVRGDGVPASLSSSPNRTTGTNPESDSLGYTYARGYHTLVTLRLDTEIIGMDKDGARILTPHRIVQSLVPLARGGARDEP
jgi:prepilin-type N-terminal cleavage/methylation domain-containing protein